MPERNKYGIPITSQPMVTFAKEPTPQQEADAIYEQEAEAVLFLEQDDMSGMYDYS